MTLDLRFAGRGIGGADDARERARDDRVSFGVLRLLRRARDVRAVEERALAL